MRSLLVLSGGHPYEAEPFAELLNSLGDWRVEHLIHPEAEQAVADGAADNADAMLFYDMPGYEFADGGVTITPPSEGFKQAIIRRFEAGKGAVMMHHAIAGWALWPEWAEMVGGRFLYQMDELRGEQKLDSGYRHDVTYTAEVIADHPVTTGLPENFEMTDELYLGEVFEKDVEPLVSAQHDFTADNFYSAAHAIAGRMFDNSDWQHPPGSNLVAWAKRARNASIVYLQFGDGPETYANPNVRRMLINALDFTSRKETP